MVGMVSNSVTCKLCSFKLTRIVTHNTLILQLVYLYGVVKPHTWTKYLKILLNVFNPNFLFGSLFHSGWLVRKKHDDF